MSRAEAPAAASRRRPRAGTTLLEMLVALGIFAIIASIVYGTFTRTAGTRAYVERRARVFAAASSALSWLERDITAAGTVGLYPTGDTPLFVSVGRAERETLRDDVPVLEVTTASSLGTTPLEIEGFAFEGQAERSDEARVVYRLEPAGGDAPETSGAAFELVRYDFRPARLAEIEHGARAVVARGVESVALRFYDGATWWESWDSRPGAANARRMPRMVETRVTIRDAEGETLTLVSGIAVASQIDAG